MIINVENVSRIYEQADNKIQVLQDMQLKIESGHSISIVGESGSGKSTLLGLLAGLDRPTTGRILFGEQNISEMSESGLTQFRGQNIGIIFQQYHLMPHLTALENVMLPLQILQISDARQKASEALEEVGLGHRLEHLPSQLSGGENQRVALARAIVHRPQLILADEPSGNLDGKTGEQVMDLMFKIIEAHKMTLVLVTHSLELARRCPSTYRLENGKLVAQ